MTYLPQHEDRAWLDSLREVPKSFKGFGRPDSVPIDWHKTENQGPIGSCQGNDLSSCVERTVYVGTRKIVQLSRIYAYLRTQQIDGLLGSDRGSTISGGGKTALEGLPLESLTGYPSSYPGKDERSRILSVGHLDYKAAEVRKCPLGTDDCLDLIGGGAAISFGVPYWSGMIPSDRIVRDFNPPSRYGWHAMAALWYPTGGNIGAVNSHADGPYQITPRAWEKMQQWRGAEFIVLLGKDEPDVDWTEGYL